MRFLVTLTSIVTVCCSFSQNHGGERPNVLVILVDDLGYSDLGFQGGEIDTPHIDRLANDGLTFTQFYNAARWARPERAS